ncbi:MAG: hypothetical protein M3O36_07500 [Myxococcota bacterium]|nr:hypothetical protein [Myxococcota bacterium]
MKNRFCWIPFLGPLALVGCAKSLAETDRPCPCASGWSCCVAADVCVMAGATCPTTAEAGPTAVADGGPLALDGQIEPPESGPDTASEGYTRVTGTCDQTEQGLINQFRSVDQVNALLVGRWQHCSGAFFSGDPDEIGIEFTQDGSWFELVQGDSGDLVRAHGFVHQGTWLVSNQGANGRGGVAVQLNIYQAQGGDGCGGPAFSTTPTKLDCFTSAAGAHVYVAIPSSGWQGLKEAGSADAGTCVYQGKEHPAGDTFPAGDGCNSCSCDPGRGGALCTLLGCWPLTDGSSDGPAE